MRRNSTIKEKIGPCPMCSDNRDKPLIKGLCQVHYWSQAKLKSSSKKQEREIRSDGLADLVADLDIIFSRYIRLRDADLFGDNFCISCGRKENWKMLQCGHFIPRAHMYTRFSELNCAPQCNDCNVRKGGNLGAFAKALELIRPGSVAILEEHATIVYKYSVHELQGMISAYSKKVKKALP